MTRAATAILAAAALLGGAACADDESDRARARTAAPAPPDRQPRQAPLEVKGFIGGAPGTDAGRFLDPADVAVYRGSANGGDTAVKILVVEGSRANSRVQRLDSEGNFELAWGRDVVRPTSAADGGTGHEVCASERSCKAARAGDGPGELDRPGAVAVSPDTGDVYVVDSGNGRVQQFSLDGDFIRGWPLDIAGGGGRLAHAAIAVSPAAPHDVFVADAAANRVLQFSARGAFERAWGWGVATGTRRFETCGSAGECRAGHPPKRRGRGPSSWPGHLAVDADGVVYGSAYFGSIFSDASEPRTRIVRFRSAPAPDPGPAGEALLDDLTPDPYAAAPANGVSRRPTNGATLGLDVDPRTGALLAINNPFGTSNLDEIHHPGASGATRPRPTVHVTDELPFLQNVTGIAAAPDGIVLLSSGRTEQPTGSSTFTGCADPDAERDCHGLIVLAPGGRPEAVPLPGAATAGGG